MDIFLDVLVGVAFLGTMAYAFTVFVEVGAKAGRLHAEEINKRNK